MRDRHVMHPSIPHVAQADDMYREISKDQGQRGPEKCKIPETERQNCFAVLLPLRLRWSPSPFRRRRRRVRRRVRPQTTVLSVLTPPPSWPRLDLRPAPRFAPRASRLFRGSHHRRVAPIDPSIHRPSLPPTPCDDLKCPRLNRCTRIRGTRCVVDGAWPWRTVLGRRRRIPRSRNSLGATTATLRTPGNERIRSAPPRFIHVSSFIIHLVRDGGRGLG